MVIDMPKITSEMNTAFNKQIQMELESSYVYLASSYWFLERELIHLANLFKTHADEERAHALKFADFINETGGTVKYMQINEPKSVSTVDEILESTLKHEESVSQAIHALYKTFIDEKKEYIGKNILDWFIKEQIEEEDKIRKLIQVRSYVSNDYFFDHRVKRMQE
jgi:ferritin